MDNYKVFETFKEGATDLFDCIPNIEEYIGDLRIEKMAIANLLHKVKENIPSIYNPEYPATCALSVSALEVSFKTRGFYAFGWRVNPNNGHYSFRVSFSDSNNSIIKKKIEASLAEKGWKSRAKIDRSNRRYDTKTKPEQTVEPIIEDALPVTD